MKYIILILISSSLLFSNSGNAQQWLNEDNKNAVRLTDVVNDYRKNIQPLMAHDDDDNNSTPITNKKGLKLQSEDKNYQFDRWLWYWQQHLDANGYMVSPIKTFEEWRIYNEKMNVANKLARTTTDNSNWVFQGPNIVDSTDSVYESQSPGIGRINVVAFHPTDANTFWIGSPGGGAWKTTDNGMSWTCMTDKLPLISVSDIVINPKNPSTIYLCTGDKDASDYYSIGVLKSTDGGNTWKLTGISWKESDLRLANSLVINPIDTNTLILGASDSIYITHNGGSTWKGKATGNFKQIIYNPIDTNILYATQRYNVVTSTSAQIFRSSDGGQSWNQVTSFTSSFRISLATTPANPAIVKALSSSSDPGNFLGLDGIYSSSDTGKTFSEIYTGGCANNLLTFDPATTTTSSGACGGQGQYDLTIAISPADANKVIIGGVDAWYSIDGGVTWTISNEWANFLVGVDLVHADKHCMQFSPVVSNRFFECNDGGIYFTENPFTDITVWNDITNGIGITEFYRVAVSNTAGFVLCGAQDNGTKALGTLTGDVRGGDGMECHIDYNDTTQMYFSNPYGALGSYNLGTNIFNSISNNIPGTPTGAWVTPYVLHPKINTIIIAGYQNVYLSTDQGNSWSAVTVTAYPTLYRVATTPADSTTLYVTEEDTNNIHYTHNLNLSGGTGTTWSDLPKPPGSGIVSDILVDPSDKDHVWVTFSGYTSDKVAEYNKASGWKLINGTLPNVPINCIQMDTSTRILYIGTDIGVFYRTTSMTDWATYNKGLPAVRVNDIQINYTTSQLWAATYGRGIWASSKEKAPISVSIIPFTINSLSVYPNPTNGNFTLTVDNEFANKNVSVRLINNNGRTVWQSNKTLDDNSHLSVNATGQPRGTYLVEVAEENSIIGRKQIVLY
ncbi:MAG TPA: T9SS type A sorting domain-containing protein [Flavipsychrobacter sp.]|nr:T9SS type A sorting domain-containing protein [Flavipsychrobacter sp.]